MSNHIRRRRLLRRSMSSAAPVKGLAKTQRLDGAGLNVVVLRTLWNVEIVDALVEGCVHELAACGVKHVRVVQVPGAFELPLAAKRLIAQSKATASPVDAVVAIGCLIKGDTPHFENICTAVSAGIMDVGLETGVPVIFGVLTVLTIEQAQKRAGLIPGEFRSALARVAPLTPACCAQACTTTARSGARRR